MSLEALKVTAEGIRQFPSKVDLCFGKSFAKSHQHFPVIFILSPQGSQPPCDTRLQIFPAIPDPTVNRSLAGKRPFPYNFISFSCQALVYDVI